MTTAGPDMQLIPLFAFLVPIVMLVHISPALQN